MEVDVILDFLNLDPDKYNQPKKTKITNFI